MRPEARLEREILRELGREADVLLLKNEVGSGFVGALYRQLCAGCRELSHRHRITYGLGVGSPDILALVGPDGRAVGLELKSETGRTSDDQATWHAAALRRAGLVTHEIRSVDDARRALERARGR